MYGPTGVAAGAGTGLLRTLHCDGSVQANVVPCDMVVNAMISAAWDLVDIKRQEFYFSSPSRLDCGIGIWIIVVIRTNSVLSSLFFRNNPESTEIPVYNYVSKDNPITYNDLQDMSSKYGIEYPTSKAIWYYSFTVNKHRFVHLLYVYFLHLLPALIIDAVTVCLGKQPRSESCSYFSSALRQKKVSSIDSTTNIFWFFFPIGYSRVTKRSTGSWTC